MGGETKDDDVSNQNAEWEVYDDSKTKENQESVNKESKFEGFRKSREYWSKMWKDGHKDGRGRDIDFKERWESLRKEGKSDVEILEALTKDNHKNKMWYRFMEEMDKSDEGSREWRVKVINKIKEHHFEMMTPEQKETYEKLKAEDKEKEFWKNYWEELHKEGHPKRPWMGFMHRRRWCEKDGHSESIKPNQEVGQSDTDVNRSRRWRSHWGWGRCNRSPKSDEKLFYKEFDFVS